MNILNWEIQNDFINNDLNINDGIYIKIPENFVLMQSRNYSLAGFDLLYKSVVVGGRSQSFNYIYLKVWNYFSLITDQDPVVVRISQMNLL
jgi:hypothetical protein